MLKSLIPARPLGRLLLAAAIAVGMSSFASANTGWLSSYNYTWNGSDTVYTLNGGDDPASITGTPIGAFNGADLDSGTPFNVGYTLFLNSEISAWADGGDTYDNFSMWYRVYSGTPSGSFTQVSTSSIDNFGGNNFRGFATGVDLGGRSAGTYTVETYLSRTWSWSGGGLTDYLTTAGATGSVPTGDYFTASFDVVPEPSTYALLGLGAAFGLWQFRRRKIN